MATAAQHDPVNGTASGTGARSTRSTIVRAATEVFARRGYDGASVREIAELAGIAKGNLTYHFAVKDDLLFEVVAQVHDRFLELAASWPATVTRPRVTLRQACYDHVLLVCAHTSETRVSYEAFRYLTAPRQAAIVLKRDRYEAELRRLVAATRHGEARVALDTRTILGLLNWPYHWFTPEGEYEPEQLATSIADMALRALRA